MGAQFEAYLRGARRLCKETNTDSIDHEFASALRARLEENISSVVHGDNDDNKTERNKIISEFNRITERLFKIQFVDYCQLDEQPQALQREEEDIERNNSSLPQNITDIHSVKSVKEGNTKPQVQENNLIEQAAHFLDTADTYITTLLPCIQNIRKALNKTRFRPQEYTDAFASFYPFAHPCIPSHSPELLKVRVILLHLNSQIKEIIKLLQECCSESQKSGKRTSKMLQDLEGLLIALQSEGEYVQLSIVSIRQKNSILNETHI